MPTNHMIEVTPEVIAWARSIVALADGPPPPLAEGDEVVYTDYYGQKQQAYVHTLFRNGRVRILTMLGGMRAGESTYEWYCTTVNGKQISQVPEKGAS